MFAQPTRGGGPALYCLSIINGEIAMPLLVTVLCAMTALAGSYYPRRLEDPQAVYLTGAKGDGVADDTAAIQRAIDAVPGQGILFIPEGRYRLSNTLSVWPGVRLIGYGANRPTFVLGANTPGYQTNEKYMVFFAGRRSAEPPTVPDNVGLSGGDFNVSNEANPGTFYSALSNVDFDIQGGNPAAVAIRGRYAQHCYLAHIDFHLGDALAGIHDIGNSADDLRFFGGQFGIITRTPSPGWQFTLLDSSFEGQQQAAIRTHATGLTLIRPSFKSVPSAIVVETGQTEQLWMSDAQMENISGPALLFDRENSLRTQINVENVVCRNVGTFAQTRETHKSFSASGAEYRVRRFTHGLGYADQGAIPSIVTDFDRDSNIPAPVPSDVPALPTMDTWVNLKDLGAKGDGITDDTAALQSAINNHRAIHLPSGHYRVSNTIQLRPDTVLVGLNPITTQIVLKDATPGFGAETEGGRRSGVPFPGKPKPLIEAPKGGACILTGIGVDTGGNNPAACGVKWMAGAKSMIDDVKFVGGHGSNVPIYNNANSGDPDPSRRWDSQYPSLWVTDGGGGTFKNIWTASTFAQAGMAITDTVTSGRVYQLSSEHHVRNEVQVRNASNWLLCALQTEEERGESSFALPLQIQDSSNITVANLNMYRVVSVFQPFPCAVNVSGSHDIRFRGVHCYSNSKASFDNLLFDADHNLELRQREFATLDIKDRIVARHGKPEVEKLAGGFFNISGGAVDSKGDFYFVDAHWHRIYRWDAAKHRATLVSDHPLYPTNLVFDRSGNMIVVSYAGKGMVYAMRPGSEEVMILKAEPTRERSGATAMLPNSDWGLNSDLVAGRPLDRPYAFASPDGSVFLPVGQDFVEGALTWGVKLQDVIRTFGLSKAEPGKPFYVTGESDMRTYRADVLPDGTLTNGRLFAEQGGECVVAAPNGDVYLAAGQIYVYSPDGHLKRTIQVPERPTQLAFSGNTLYICARTSLYTIKIH